MLWVSNMKWGFFYLRALEYEKTNLLLVIDLAYHVIGGITCWSNLN
jgi:hypothetical protein